MKHAASRVTILILLIILLFAFLSWKSSQIEEMQQDEVLIEEVSVDGVLGESSELGEELNIK